MSDPPLYVALVAADEAEAGTRIRLEFPSDHLDPVDGALAVLAQERTLPERMFDPNARHIEAQVSIYFTRADCVWLRARLDELLEVMPS